MIKVLVFIAIALLPSITTAKAIVVLGDSISAAYGMGVEQGWVALLQTKLKQEGLDYRVFNESISGDTSAGGLARIDRALTAHKPNIVLLELGANDGLRGLPPEQMQANLKTIIQRSQQAGAKVLLLGMKIPPNYGKRFVDMFYNIYPKLATELQIPSIPFLLEDVALDKDMMQADGLHPNAKAQALIMEKVWAQLKTLL
ncbi:MAG: arylesterase [Methylococcaceae bacterium]|jgi:acyl-CoA thioesterase-1